PRSGGRSTRSPPPRSTAARSATGRAVPTACARIAGSTAVARSCTCTTTITITTTELVTVPVDVKGADKGPAEVARGAGLVRGVHRPALALLVPVPGAPFLLLDAGANVEVRPEHLVQFAHMGAAFMEAVGGVANPRVALLANGTEPSKGTETIIAAHEALAEM